VFTDTLWKDVNLNVHDLITEREREREGEREREREAIFRLTDTTVLLLLGTKRASKTVPTFDLAQEDGACEHAVRKPLNAPKTPCLVTPCVLQHKRRQRISPKKRQAKENKGEAADCRICQENEGSQRKKNARNRSPKDVGCPR
jgi:small subunit ribosomal protein S6e